MTLWFITAATTHDEHANTFNWIQYIFWNRTILKFAIPKARKAVAGRENGKSKIVKIADVFKQGYWRLANLLEKEVSWKIFIFQIAAILLHTLLQMTLPTQDWPNQVCAKILSDTSLPACCGGSCYVRTYSTRLAERKERQCPRSMSVDVMDILMSFAYRDSGSRPLNSGFQVAVNHSTGGAFGLVRGYLSSSGDHVKQTREQNYLSFSLSQTTNAGYLHIRNLFGFRVTFQKLNLCFF